MDEGIINIKGEVFFPFLFLTVLCVPIVYS